MDIPSRRSPRSSLFALAVGVALIAAAPAAAQILVVSPDCGIAGTTVVQIKGSGWAEPAPICEYIFYF